MHAADTCAHADGGIHNAKRRNRTKGVASDIACSVNTEFFQYIVDTSVRTSRTEDRRTVRHLRRRFCLHLLTQYSLTQHICAVLAQQCKDLLALAVNAHRTHLGLNHGIQFFYYI